MATDYQLKQASFLTKHGKERVVLPLLKESLGLEVRHVDSFDTDQFGTFTRDIERKGNQLEAAIAKARKGMEIAGTKIGIASEGLFTTDPYAGMFPWNNEIVVLVDDAIDIVVVGMASSHAQSYSTLVDDLADLESHLNKANFPSHHLVVRPENHSNPNFVKGVSTLEELHAAFISAKNIGLNGKVFIENDLRAFANPTRMQNIFSATINLTEKIKSTCPQCGFPGFWLTKLNTGLICSGCNSLTKQAKSKTYSCLKCGHEEIRGVKKAFADPRECNYCNP